MRSLKALAHGGVVRGLVLLAVLSGVAAGQCGMKVIRAARVLDVKSGQYVANPAITIEGERIKEIIHCGRAVAEVELVDLAGITLPPGLIDCHTHLLSDYDPEAGDDEANGILTVARMSSAQRALLGAKIAREVLDAGITTVRHLGNSGRNADVALRAPAGGTWGSRS